MADNDIHEEQISNPQEQQIEVEFASNPHERTPHAAPQVKRLQGWYIIVILLVIVAGGTFLPAIKLAADEIFRSIDFYGVDYELLDYIKKNKQQFPAAEKWCDALLEKKDDYVLFGRFEDNKENFPYTLNKYILGYDGIPDNMVVFFIGSSGWNQVGDYNSVKNQDRVRVFFGNGDSRTFRKKEIPYLRWKFEDSGIVPAPDVKSSLIILTVSLAIVFLGIWMKYRKCLKVFWIFAFGMGIISAGTGALLGGMAESYYNLDPTGNYLTLLIGGVWGFVIGVSFIAIIGKIYIKYNARVSMLGYATVIGAITGIAASSIVHGYLMIAYEEESFSYMMAASCFGIIAGLFLGWIASGLIRFYKNNPAILNITTE